MASAAAAADGAPRQLVGALDQGTTSTRFILFDVATGSPVASHQMTHTQHYPQPGWVEHCPMEILDCAKQCIDGAVTSGSVDPASVKAVGITNQRETTVVWDKESGVPLCRAIVWLDTRTRSTCESLKKRIDVDRVRELCGLPVSTYFSGVKLRWLMDERPAVKEALNAGTALFGTIDTWLVWNLSGRATHVTDVTNAGRTMLMDIRTMDWNDELVEALGVPRSCLPTIRSCAEVYGKMAGKVGEKAGTIGEMAGTVLAGVPISGIMGDQQAALVGQSCFRVGEAKATYGTGCFLIVNTGDTPVFSSKGLLTTPAYQLGPDAPPVYALEGSIAIAGAAISWLRDNLHLIHTAAEVEALAASVPDTGDVYFVPALSGLFAPRWRPDARGTSCWDDPVHDRRSHCAGDARGDCVPGHGSAPRCRRGPFGKRRFGCLCRRPRRRRRRRGDQRGRQRHDLVHPRSTCRRRCERQQPADANAGKPGRCPRSASGSRRDDRSRRCFCGGLGRRRL
eukprot:TRINITY_DN1922_c0_g1_i10.p1 TRINITY_DN1922_c0_g1~~TRINITY_DN1922_c0_g1_i10.p1  ORF type:complete len:509 (+),score=88.82 TRINITY_DN1922_c0_g1_i10:171-1697(+)